MRDAAGDRRVPAERLLESCAAKLVAHGVPPDQARTASIAIVEADLRGVSSHGVRLLDGYLQRLRDGGLNPRPCLQVLTEAPAAAVLDGDGGLGHVVATRAMEIAAAKAGRTGIGACAAAHSSHFGMAAVYAEMAAREGLIGIALSNSAAMMPPPGGAEARVGVGAFAYAVPGEEEPDLEADFSLSITSRGRILELADAGLRLAQGSALDAQGRPTDDPAAAAAGLLLPAGEYKGFALALLIDVLSGVLGGSRFGVNVVRPPAGERGDIGHFLLAIDPAFFGSAERFRTSIDGIVGSLRSTRPREGDEVRLPGTRSRAIRERNLRDGVPLPASLLAKLGLDQDL